MADTIDMSGLKHTKQGALTRIFDELQYIQKKDLLGKFLTVIDSVISDPRQNKAVKDVVNQIVWEIHDGTSPNAWIAENILTDTGNRNIGINSVISNLIESYREATE